MKTITATYERSRGAWSIQAPVKPGQNETFVIEVQGGNMPVTIKDLDSGNLFSGHPEVPEDKARGIVRVASRHIVEKEGRYYAMAEKDLGTVLSLLAYNIEKGFVKWGRLQPGKTYTLRLLEEPPGNPDAGKAAYNEITNLKYDNGQTFDY